MSFKKFLCDIGVNVCASTISDLINQNINIQGFKQVLGRKFGISDSQSDSIIKFFVDQGKIEISGTSIVAKDRIHYDSTSDSTIDIKTKVNSRTNGTSIKTGNGGIKLTGNASIMQKG